MTNYWNRELETMPQDQLKKMQLDLLQKLVKHVYESSPFYRKRMDENKVKPEDIKTLDDIRKLPFMKKTDLRDNYPDKLFMVPYDDLVRVHVSSGTTGKPTVVGYTRNDIENWSDSLARGMTAFGATNKDMLENAHGYGLFTGGLGVHYAAEKIGATVLPTSTGNTSRQIDLMMDMPVSIIAGTPSYLFHIADECDKRKVDIRKDTHLRMAIAGGEPWSESMRKKLQDRTGIRMHNCYGASEFYGPMFLECSEQCGPHIWADLALFEILDKDGNPCRDGENGELVVTMLKKEAFPLIRYRIGDITSLTWEKCKCGRTHPRMGRIQGRTDDMLVVKGINVFPSQIEAVIGEMPFLNMFYRITLTNENYSDEMLVEVELNESALTDDVFEHARLGNILANRLKDVLNIKAHVKLVLPGTLERFEGKSKHIVDKRSYE